MELKNASKTNQFRNPQQNRPIPDVTVGTKTGLSLRLEDIYLERLPTLCTLLVEKYCQLATHR
jgi:hypothetical protein